MPVIPGWSIVDYNDISAKHDSTLPSGCSWETFEVFNARFRYFKSLCLDEGQQTKISEIHYGAHINGDITFRNHHLSVAKAAGWTDTRSSQNNSTEWTVGSEKSIGMRQHKHIVLNAYSAPYGDAVLSLDVQPPVNEVHQYKFTKRLSGIKQDDYNLERDKAASQQDFFILFTNSERRKDLVLPKNSGIVDRKNWMEYFGPFSGRAFFYSAKGLWNINDASSTTLQLVDGVGVGLAKKIIEHRPFSSVQDAVRRTGIKRKVLEMYKYE